MAHYLRTIQIEALGPVISAVRAMTWSKVYAENCDTGLVDISIDHPTPYEDWESFKLIRDVTRVVEITAVCRRHPWMDEALSDYAAVWHAEPNASEQAVG